MTRYVLVCLILLNIKLFSSEQHSIHLVKVVGSELVRESSMTPEYTTAVHRVHIDCPYSQQEIDSLFKLHHARVTKQFPKYTNIDEYMVETISQEYKNTFEANQLRYGHSPLENNSPPQETGYGLAAKDPLRHFLLNVGAIEEGENKDTNRYTNHEEINISEKQSLDWYSKDSSLYFDFYSAMQFTNNEFKIKLEVLKTFSGTTTFDTITCYHYSEFTTHLPSENKHLLASLMLKDGKYTLLPCSYFDLYRISSEGWVTDYALPCYELWENRIDSNRLQQVAIADSVNLEDVQLLRMYDRKAVEKYYPNQKPTHGYRLEDLVECLKEYK